MKSVFKISAFFACAMMVAGPANSADRGFVVLGAKTQNAAKAPVKAAKLASAPAAEKIVKTLDAKKLPLDQLPAEMGNLRGTIDRAEGEIFFAFELLADGILLKKEADEAYSGS